MNTMRCEIVTQERQIYAADDVQMVLAPGVEGQPGILPHHAPLLTLDEGVMQSRASRKQANRLVLYRKPGDKIGTVWATETGR